MTEQKNNKKFYERKWFMAILGIVVLETIAVFTGIDENGITLATSLALLAGLGGFELGRGDD